MKSQKCGTHTTLDCAVCLPLIIISEIQSKIWDITHYHSSTVATQSFWKTNVNGLAQATWQDCFTTTFTVESTM